MRPCVAVHKTQEEESLITTGRTTTHGRIDEGILWFELTDGSAAISTAISKAPDDDHIGRNM
jgi:hypothetical protein